MDIFAELPIDITKKIYRHACELRDLERVREMRIAHAVECVADDLRRTNIANHAILDEYDIKTTVVDTVERAHGDDEFYYVILNRRCVINDVIVIEYLRGHAMPKNVRANSRRKIIFRERFKIYRVDHHCKLLASLRVGIEPIVVRESDVLALK